MKLLRLHLKAVGPFTGAELDLSDGDHGLHLVYGPNEAGKSSALRALSYLLFGFPHLSADDFLHPNEQLRVGATLRHSDGEELEVLRRRGNKNTLRGADDVSVVPTERLERFLGGLEQSAFETLFGIDQERLRRAGEEIRTGQGQFGELLFAAGAGLSGLRQAQQLLQDRLDTLFKPRGQNPRINKALLDLREAEAEQKDRRLPSEDWQRHDQAWHEAEARAVDLRRRLDELRREQHRLTRLRAALPLVARGRRLREELERLGAAVRLRADFGRESRAALDAFHLAERTIEEARAALGDIDARLADLDPPRALLDAAGEIEALQERLGAIEKADEDRPRLENFRDDRAHRAREILRELGRPAELDEVESLRIRADEPAIIRNLGQKRAELRGQVDEARKTIARHEGQIERQEREGAGLAVPPDVAPLRRAVRQAQKAGDLDERLVEARALLAKVEKKAARALTRLPGWGGSADDLQRQAIPLDATLDRLEAAFQDVGRERQALDDRQAAEHDASRALEAQVQALEHEQDVPTEEALQAARDRREEGWRLVRAAWLDGTDGDDRLAAFLAETAPGRTLAEAYERCVRRGDDLADRLRREADRVGRKSEWLAQLDRHRAALAALAADRLRLDERQALLDAEWNALVDPLGVEARGPAELRGWLRARAEVVRLIEQAEEARQAVEPLGEARDAHRAALRSALEEIGEPPPPARSGLAEWLDHVEAAIKRAEDLAKQRDRLEGKLHDARRERDSARLSIGASEAELGDWRAEWSAKMARIGLEADADPAQAGVFLDKIQDLESVVQQHREFVSRLRGMDRDAEKFLDDVAKVSGRLAPDLAGQPADDQARELARRLRDAQAVEQQRAALAEQRRREAGRLVDAAAKHEAARISLERLCREAGCAGPDALPEAERRSQALGRLEDDLRACEEELLAAAAGADVTAFTAEVERIDPDRLGAEVERLEGEVAALEAERNVVNQAIGSERNELARMDGRDDGAPEAAAKVQSIRAQLQGDVARFATLKLSAAVLRRGIERYREKSQGPVLERASQLFADLTDGSFARLQTDDDGEGGTVLKGVRADGRLVGVEGMSDGSHDQLYLALRLASLESWLRAHEPVPFVVDDILTNFDDRRATAALRALAELSTHTQVLFFTHHRHVVELARAHLPGDVLFIQELPGLRDDRELISNSSPNSVSPAISGAS